MHQPDGDENSKPEVIAGSELWRVSACSSLQEYAESGVIELEKKERTLYFIKHVQSPMVRPPPTKPQLPLSLLTIN